MPALEELPMRPAILPPNPAESVSSVAAPDSLAGVGDCPPRGDDGWFVPGRPDAEPGRADGGVVRSGSPAAGFAAVGSVLADGEAVLSEAGSAERGGAVLAVVAAAR